MFFEGKKSRQRNSVLFNFATTTLTVWRGVELDVRVSVEIVRVVCILAVRSRLDDGFALRPAFNTLRMIAIFRELWI